MVNGPNMFPVSSNATNVAFLEGDMVFCESHCVKMINSGTVSVISGSTSAGDFDGSAPKLCQLLGIFVEFDHNVYLTDSGSGSVKLINRLTKGMAEFLQNSKTLVRDFDIHSRKNPLTEPHHTIDQGIKLVENVLQYVQACSQKAKVLKSLKESSTTDGPEGAISNNSLKSLELLKKSLSSIKAKK